MELSDNHFSITSAGEIQQICQPFFDATGIIYFCYQRLYKSGHNAVLQNIPYLNKYWFQTEYGNLANLISLRLNSGSGQHLWSSNTNLSNSLANIKKIFDTDNHFEIINEHPNYLEIFHFAGKSGNNEVLELYLNKQYLLTNFKFYFLEKAKFLISQAIKPNNLIDFSHYLKKVPRINNETIRQALVYLQNNTKRYYIGSYKDQYLTKREFECLLYSLQGKTSVEIAIILKISEKTVRSYLEVVRDKMEVTSKSKLIEKALSLGLLDLIKVK